MVWFGSSKEGPAMAGLHNDIALAGKSSRCPMATTFVTFK
jgi:hypothetical protein